ncbi:Predicted phosphohydrolases [Aquiflexum balticum DSM 16537]|uniref:Predicted phosphohydrolases n=1 Tax=Aquiflexum balticum DSM 16537 TaxID=758820 RepID=A0A1W2H458_9BACT|nr:calcineurin-like phosphoesterase family protein [Aquiflexum balticum]SMD43681.1 Predicted phosphohydrolases [Aquiflexum balticum DSM 16537]
MKKIQLLFVALIFTGSAFAQQNVSGTVYEDLNANGKKERREKGLPNVAVSNGLQVVQTDKNGKYELPLAEDQTIFVIKPASHELPTDANNIPQFYYIHKPNGSPANMKYPGVAPTGKLPKSVDFGLLPSNTDKKFTALIFGDPQPYTLDEIAYFKKGIVSEVENIQGVAFGAALGDLVGDRPDFFPLYAEAVGKIGVPWFQVMGNHDMNFDADKDEYSDESFTANFGPATYAFNYGDAHFVVLEDILYPDPRDGQGYWGGLRPDQLQFLENNLKLVPKDKLIVLLMHIPLFEENGDSFRDADREKILELLSPFAKTLSMSAHTHYMKQTFFGKEDGYNQPKAHHHYNVGTPSGDWYSGKILADGTPDATMRDGSPKGYLFLDINNADFKVRYKAAGKSDTYQMEIFAPKVLAKDVRTSSSIVVNFFTGAADNKVRYRINQGEWKNMTQMESYDPTYLLKVYEWDTTEEVMPGRRPSNPAITDHLWRAPISSNMEVGEHTIEVEATDIFGQVHRGKKTFKVMDAN